MKELKIQFTRPKGHKFPILSKIIRWAEKTPYSHVRLKWINTTGTSLVYEASGDEVKFLGPMAQLRAPVEIVSEFVFTLDQEAYRRLVKICMKYAGIKYSKKQLIGLLLVKLLRLKKNPIRDGHQGQICTELGARICNEVLYLNLEIDYDTAGLRELHNLLDKRKQQ